MGESAKNRIESIVSVLEQKGVPAAPVLEANDLARSNPEAVSDLAIAVMKRFPKGGTFLDGALSFMPQDDWPGLVQFALDEIERSESINEAAESVIQYASLQCPSSLHPHLDRIFISRPNANTYFAYYAWRESGELHFPFLKRVLDGTDSSVDDRNRAWRALLETRNPHLVEYAMSLSERIVPTDWQLKTWVQANLHLVGFDFERETLRRVCTDSSLHFLFPSEFFETQSRPPWLARIHPTWCLNGPEKSVSFGGMSSGNCSLCGNQLHTLIALNSIPIELGITGLQRLEIATCLSCLGWEIQPLFYAHEIDGSVANIGYDGPKVTPQFFEGPLLECEIGMAQTPARWLMQSWGSSNSRENLNRIGGEPSWIQDAEFPHCPMCSRLMPFLFQLDSDLTAAEGGEWLWGSGGIVYGFWCDDCKISGMLWQCT